MAVLGLLLYLPWIYGMVTWGQQLLLLPWMTVILGLTWLYIAASQSIRFYGSPLLLSLGALVLAALLQVIPLPDFLYESFAPAARFEKEAIGRAAQFLAVDPTDADLLKASQLSASAHRCISISPYQTRASLVGLTSALIMFFCCSYLFRDRTGKVVLLVSLSLTSTAVAILGVLQNISWNQWTLLGESVSRGFATFVSRNSAPQYLAIGIGCTIAFAMSWLAQKRSKIRYSQRYHATNWASRIRHSVEDAFREIDAVVILVAVAMVLQIAGVVGSASRGGFVALLFALCVTVLLTLGRSRRFQVSGIAGACALAVLVMVFANSFELDEDLATRLEVDRLQSSLRVEFWKLAVSQSEFWWTGCGLGAFHFGIMHANKLLPFWIYHAESIYVEVFSELGAMGLLIALTGLGWLFWQLLRRWDSKSSIIWPAMLYSTCAIALQSLVDFSLIIPAIFLSMAAISGAFHHELEQSRRRSSEGKRQPGSLRPKLLVSVLMIGLVIVLWQGAGPLSGFAQAEKIESEDWNSRIESALAAKLLPAALDVNHPEVALQLAKRMVTTTEQYLEAATRWPDEITAKDRAQFSRLEFANALLRSTDNQQWASLIDQWNADQRLHSAIRSASEGFVHSTRLSPYDWRGHWGQYQTQVDTEVTTQALRAARLQILTHSMPQLQQAAGTCELLAGNKNMGVEFWRDSLKYHPEQTYRLVPLVGVALDADTLEQVLPQAAIPRTVLSRRLMERKETRQVGQKLLEAIDVAAATAEAESEFHWAAVAWLTQQRGETEAYIDSLRKLSTLRPMDKSVRIRLAEMLESVGDIEEAIQQVEQANRRTLLTPSEERLLERLKEKIRSAR